MNGSLFGVTDIYGGFAPECPRFDGADISHARDTVRLTKQIKRVYEAMKSGSWMSVAEIHAITGDPENSIQSQIRNLRKEKFGGHKTETRRRGGSSLYEYRLVK